jgi:hypothetical protein
MYFDQGTSYMWAKFNLITRVAGGCFVNSTPSHGDGNPNAPFLPQYNLFENNIVGPCGSTQMGALGAIFERRGDNTNSVTIRRNLIYFNSKAGMHIQKQPGHWGCFDYTVTPPTAVACTTQFKFELNAYQDAGK